MRNVVLVGGATGREHAIAKQFNEEGYGLSAILWADNLFIEKLCTGKYLKINLDNVQEVYKAIIEINPDYVVIGQGEVIQRGLCDMLKKKGIKCIGPSKKLAQLEGSKTFCRDLLTEIDVLLLDLEYEFMKTTRKRKPYKMQIIG